MKSLQGRPYRLLPLSFIEDLGQVRGYCKLAKPLVRDRVCVPRGKTFWVASGYVLTADLPPCSAQRDSQHPPRMPVRECTVEGFPNQIAHTQVSGLVGSVVVSAHRSPCCAYPPMALDVGVGHMEKES